MNHNVIPIAQFDLDALMRQILTANQLITEVALCLASGDPEALMTAARLTAQAHESTATTLERLQRLGGATAYMPPPEPVPLNLQDTPATRRLFALLTEAQAAAEAVDAERGRGNPTSLSSDTPPSGRSYGFDLAESISELRLRVRNPVVESADSRREEGL